MTRPKKLLRLESITLRGVGSYFDGAELKIRPLTVLCGKNGSGKSTWFNTIRLLQNSLAKGMLPFDFDAYDELYDMQVINAGMYARLPNDLPVNESDDDRFGHRGAIGLNSTAACDGPLFDDHELGAAPRARHPAESLLLGSCRKGASFRLRLAHTTSEGRDEDRPHLIELVFDGIYVIKMTRPISPRGTKVTPLYTLECSRAFLPAATEADDVVVEIMRFHPPYRERSPIDIKPLIPDLPSPIQFLENCIRLIRSVLQHTLQGFFLISAVRDRQEISSLKPSPTDEDPHYLLDELDRPFDQRDALRRRTSEELIRGIRSYLDRAKADELAPARYVGPHGEASHDLWRRFCEHAMYDVGVPHVYRLNSFLSFWLKRLLDIEIADAEALPSSAQPKSLCGYLSGTAPEPPGDADPRRLETEPEDLWRFAHPCFGSDWPQPPARLSSGFHQLMPIILQTALLQHGEIMAIENPEVHLHPSQQLAVAEFLMRQALGGKTILVETHSDLIIRRLMRAILEEEIKQEALSIQFASLKKPDQGHIEAQSSLEPLHISDRGQIENWPDGFLDEDIKESRRLFEIMYGAMPESDAEDSE